MANAPDHITDAIKRTLDAAEAANAAADDISRLSAAHRSFADGVARRQRMSAALAAGAALGAVAGVALCGLVWVRSVADLREAGEVQAVAAELLVEQVARFDSMLDQAEKREALVQDTLTAMTDQVGRDLAKLGRSQQPMEAQVAAAMREGVKEDVTAAKDELLAALATIGLEGGQDATLKVLVEEMQALTRGMAAGAEPAAAVAPKAKPVAARPAATKPAKPVPRPAKAVEPDPFVYP